MSDPKAWSRQFDLIKRDLRRSPPRRDRVQTLCADAWIWYVGSAVWTLDGVISVRLRSWQHAELAFLLALVFLAAGLLYGRQSR